MFHSELRRGKPLPKNNIWYSHEKTADLLFLGLLFTNWGSYEFNHAWGEMYSRNRVNFRKLLKVDIRTQRISGAVSVYDF